MTNMNLAFKQILYALVGGMAFFSLAVVTVLSGGLFLISHEGEQAASKNTVVTVEASGMGAKPPLARPTAAPLLSISAPTPAPLWQMIQRVQVPLAPVQATAGIVVDDISGNVLMAKNADKPLPMASITKLMTAYITLERGRLMDKIVVSAKAAATPPTNLPLGEGETLSVNELLTALLLPSANDAAQALADGLGGEEDFVRAMNTQASKLGLRHTHFSNPTGFDAAGHASSAADLATLAHDLFKAHPEVLPIMQQSHAVLETTTEHKRYDLQNFHPLITKYAGYMGGKPGFTGDAGNCLLTLAQRGEKRVIVVVLNSPNAGEESSQLLDAGFATH